MKEEEYHKQKDILEARCLSYRNQLNSIENEYDDKMRNDSRYIRCIKLIQKYYDLIDDLTHLWYNDNRVYRTGERQLATRIDGSIEQEKACLIF